VDAGGAAVAGPCQTLLSDQYLLDWGDLADIKLDSSIAANRGRFAKSSCSAFLKPQQGWQIKYSKFLDIMGLEF
jgi:hypothetical protein